MHLVPPKLQPYQASMLSVELIRWAGLRVRSISVCSHSINVLLRWYLHLLHWEPKEGGIEVFICLATLGARYTSITNVADLRLGFSQRIS